PSPPDPRMAPGRGGGCRARGAAVSLALLGVVAFAGVAEVAAQGASDPSPFPAPGRPGTEASPDARAFPQGIARITEGVTGVTRTWREAERFRNVSEADLRDPPAADWLHWRAGPGSWGHSALSQIHAGNVGSLRLAWVWGMEP